MRVIWIDFCVARIGDFNGVVSVIKSAKINADFDGARAPAGHDGSAMFSGSATCKKNVILKKAAATVSETLRRFDACLIFVPAMKKFVLLLLVLAVMFGAGLWVGCITTPHGRKTVAPPSQAVAAGNAAEKLGVEQIAHFPIARGGIENTPWFVHVGIVARQVVENDRDGSIRDSSLVLLHETENLGRLAAL